jgi:hypothetical protein
MFRGIAEFAVKGRWQTASMAALLSMAAMFLPPLNYLASGVIALTTLRMGPKEGVSVLLATLVTFGLLAGLVMGQIWMAGLVLLSVWLPVFLVTLALGYSRSLSLAVLAATGLGGLVIIVMHLLVPDQTVFWTGLIGPVLQGLSEQANWPYDSATTENVVTSLAGMMTGFVAAGVSFNALVGVMIGRAWQAQLFNPGAFGSEFRQLRLGKPLALVTTVLMLLTATTMGTSVPILSDALPMLLLAMSLQGLAIVHAIVKARNMGKAWLVVMYIMLVVLSGQMLIILAGLGVLDQWFNFRQYAKKEA